MKQKLKYHKEDHVKVFGKIFKITNVIRNGFKGLEYDLEAMLPDKNNNFEKMYKIPQGFIAGRA